MDFSHFNDQGRAKMVDVTQKDETYRIAKAGAKVKVNSATMQKIKSGGIKKGDVLAVAQVAGIMAAKKTSYTIPMCHPIMISGVDINFKLTNNEINIISTVKCKGATGVEMEALNAACTAALTIYDMCKSVQRDIEITDIMLLEKSGGKSGIFKRDNKNATVLSTCISEQKGTKKHEVPFVELKNDYGIIGDAHAGKWHRQISLLANESIDTIRQAGVVVSAGDFAENILTQGINLKELTINTKIKIADTILQVTQIGKECHTDCEIKKTVGKCVMPTEGVFAKVIKGGKIQKGDVIEIIKEDI